VSAVTEGRTWGLNLHLTDGPGGKLAKQDVYIITRVQSNPGTLPLPGFVCCLAV